MEAGRPLRSPAPRRSVPRLAVLPGEAARGEGGSGSGGGPPALGPPPPRGPPSRRAAPPGGGVPAARCGRSGRGSLPPSGHRAQASSLAGAPSRGGGGFLSSEGRPLRPPRWGGGGGERGSRGGGGPPPNRARRRGPSSAPAVPPPPPDPGVDRRMPGGGGGGRGASSAPAAPAPSVVPAFPPGNGTERARGGRGRGGRSPPSPVPSLPLDSGSRGSKLAQRSPSRSPCARAPGGAPPRGGGGPTRRRPDLSGAAATHTDAGPGWGPPGDARPLGSGPPGGPPFLLEVGGLRSRRLLGRPPAPAPIRGGPPGAESAEGPRAPAFVRAEAPRAAALERAGGGPTGGVPEEAPRGGVVHAHAMRACASRGRKDWDSKKNGTCWCTCYAPGPAREAHGRGWRRACKGGPTGGVAGGGRGGHARIRFTNSWIFFVAYSLQNLQAYRLVFQRKNTPAQQMGNRPPS